MADWRSENLSTPVRFSEKCLYAGAKIVSNNYWSSSENSATNPFNLNFNNGNVNTNNNKSNSNYVRCVRGHLIFSQVASYKLYVMAEYEQLPLYLKFYQFIKFLNEMVRNFPKHHKYALGGNILDLTWKCLDLVLEANGLPNDKKYPKIKELSIEFDKLKIRIRMAQEIKLISAGQFSHIQTYYAKEIGEMTGGWLNWATSYNLQPIT